MKPYERFLIALNRGIPDRVPVFEHLFSPSLQEKLVGYKTELYDGKAVIQLAAKLGIDATAIPIGGFCGFSDSNSDEKTYVDEWGVSYIKQGWPIMVQVNNPVKNRKDWKAYKFPKPIDQKRSIRLRDAISANNENIGIVVAVLGPLTMLYWYLMGILNMSLVLKDDPKLISEIANEYSEWVIAAARKISENAGFHAFMISDDWGYKNSLLVSPSCLRKYFLKPFEKIVHGLKELGYPVIMHNDGNLWEVLDDLVATGIDGYHPLERAATMDLKKVKEKYKGILCPIGNVDNKKTMVSGTSRDVKFETLNCLEVGAPGGGYIISTDHSLHDDIPYLNIYTFINTVKTYGKYPFRKRRDYV